MRKNLIICLLALVILAVAATSAAAAQSYILKQGDTLDIVAAKYGVTLEALMLQNKLTSTDVEPGTRLVIPSRIQPSRSGSIRDTAGYPDLVAYAKTFLGTPYVYGGTSPNGFDCSGFVQYCYSNFYGIELPRTASSQYNAGTNVDKANLIPGDLVFFNSLGHVGIYIGEGEFIHSSSPTSGGVIISSLDEAYYANGYFGATRIQN